jgi:hypothetical protein
MTSISLHFHAGSDARQRTRCIIRSQRKGNSATATFLGIKIVLPNPQPEEGEEVRVGQFKVRTLMAISASREPPLASKHTTNGLLSGNSVLVVAGDSFADYDVQGFC